MRARGRVIGLACAGALGLALLGGCARVAPYQGPPAGAAPTARELEATGSPDSTVVLVYGDNRPGLRMQTRSRVYRYLRYHGHTGAKRVALAVLLSPFYVLESIIPTLDGPRDIVTSFTKRPRAGGEREVLDAMLAEKAAGLVISTGDVVQDGRRGRQWEDFVARHRALRSRVPYVVAPGNHEHLEAAISRDSWNTAIGTPARADRYWRSVDLPDHLARFVFVDANVLANVKGVYPDSLADALSREQLAWVDQALKPEFRYRFVVLHHPLVPAGHHTTDWDSSASAARRAQLLRLCRDRGVTAILAGHEHLYQRVFLRDARGGGLWHVTTGGGGSPLHGVSAAKRNAVKDTPLIEALTLDPSTIRARTAYHYCRLVLPRAEGRAPTLVAMEVRHGRAREMDRIVLAAPKGTP